MFTKRHEQELAEIKATTHRLVERFEEILEQLQRIKQNQDELNAGARRAGDGRKRRRRAGNSGPTEE